MVRGEIWWANLPYPKGSEPGKHRPVLVIQCDNLNRSKINTVICAMITSNIEIASLPGNLLLEKSVSGLGKTSAVNFSQLLTIDKTDLKNHVGMLSKPIIEKVNNCLKTVLQIC